MTFLRDHLGGKLSSEHCAKMIHEVVCRALVDDLPFPAPRRVQGDGVECKIFGCSLLITIGHQRFEVFVHRQEFSPP